MTDCPTTTDIDRPPPKRPDLSGLGAGQLAPIESRTSGWPESWRDFARSLYVTLISRARPLSSGDAVGLAVELTLGIAADLAGEQPYINIGRSLQSSALAARVIELLARHRQDYDRVGHLVGKSPRHIRRIEADWLRIERARRQGALSFE